MSWRARCAFIAASLIVNGVIAATARADDLTAKENNYGQTTSSTPVGVDTAPDTGLDFTILHSRVALTNEFKDQELGAAKDTVTLNLAYAFGNPARYDWTVQVDLPAVYYDAGNTGSNSTTTLGDIEARIGHVLVSEGLFRCAVGGEVEFDTGGGPPAGDGIFRLSPIVAFAIQPSNTFKFQMFAQFNQSLITETGVREEQEIHLKPAVNVALPANSYAYTEFEETWALPAHGAFSSTFKIEFGHGFGARSEWALSARCELPLTKSSDDYTLTVGCTYVFK